MAKADEKGKYGTIKSSTTKFHKDEPLFLIRSTDPYAVHVVIEYARRLEQEGADPSYTDDIFDVAMRIAEWQRENPELVKDVFKEDRES